MHKMYELVLEKMDYPVYNMPEQRGTAQKPYLYRSLRGICKEIKKEVFSL